MDLLAAYASDEESGSPASAVAEAPVIIPAKVVDAAPVVTYNPSTAIMPFGMPMPMLGPANPHRVNVISTTTSTVGYIDPYTFSDEYHNFLKVGAGPDPADSRRLVRAPQAIALPLLQKDKKKRARGDPADASYLGPWAGFEGEEEDRLSSIARGALTEEQKKYRESMGLDKDKEPAPKAAKGAGSDEDEAAEPSDAAAASKAAGASSSGRRRGGADAEKSDSEEDVPEKRSTRPVPAYRAGMSIEETKSVFHGKQQRDYQGRSWIEPPKGVRPDPDHDCFIPKKLIHTWTGHTKGVQTIQLFPNHGHLLLSGSADTKIKIWDVHNQRHCKRTYMGHTGGIKEVQFSDDGLKFLSCSYDRHVKLWDTETGACLGDYSNKKMAYCTRFYPLDPTTFMVGSGNNNIVQWDTRTGDISLEYSHHLGPVNTVTFTDEARRFISTSDDKKILVWDFNTPVPIKYISDPDLHSVPVVTTHPSGGYFIGQSMDNQIVVYDTHKFCQRSKKTFKGHLAAGYACQLGFSPNGRTVISGDGEGKLWFWDWKTSKVLKKFVAHTSGPCIGALWHPVDPSHVITCGWDGLIKLWD